MQDSKKKNEIVRSGINNGILNPALKGGPSQDVADDAGALASFIRENKEDQALTQTNDSRDVRNEEMVSGKQLRNLYNKDRKVIRQKVTRTHADGTQTTKFKFIIKDCDDEIIAQVSKKDKDYMKKRVMFKLDYKKKPTHSDNPVGHSLFEEDESTIKLIQKRRTSRGRGRRSDGDYVPPRGKATPGSQSKLKGKQDKRRQKRKRDEDDDDIYTRPTVRRGANNRKGRVSARELKPHAKMAESLEDIRSSVENEKRLDSGPFHRPVDRISHPSYYEIISNPIDLQTIRDKIKRYVNTSLCGNMPPTITSI